MCEVLQSTLCLGVCLPKYNLEITIYNLHVHVHVHVGGLPENYGRYIYKTIRKSHPQALPKTGESPVYVLGSSPFFDHSRDSLETRLPCTHVDMFTPTGAPPTHLPSFVTLFLYLQAHQLHLEHTLSPSHLVCRVCGYYAVLGWEVHGAGEVW